jgi:hypothetical protein
VAINVTPSVVVDIIPAPDPSPAQQAAWAALWRRLLAPMNESPAPAMPAGTGLECAREPDAPMDHDREVINDPTT